MAIPDEFHFMIRDCREGTKTPHTTLSFPATATIWTMRKAIENKLGPGDFEMYWKLGSSFMEEKEECLTDLPHEVSLRQFVKDHSLDFGGKCGGEYYLVIHPKPISEGNKEENQFEPDWLFSPPTYPPASASSSVEANVGSCDNPSSSISVPEYGASLPKRQIANNDALLHMPLNINSNETMPAVPPALEPSSPPQGGAFSFQLGSSQRQSAGFIQQAKRDADDVYVGLVNQAMTCYLNSLIQTLFMTPEFRNALYNWEYTGSKEEQTRSIPYQLQKLFVLLQTSVNVKTALETKELTRSFGWDSSHAWDQHDVQELCRVMFDALELKWRRTNQATVITALYQGTMKDYVKCLECCTENAKNDVFLDLPLAVKPFGAHVAYRSIEEALQAFVQPEVLDGTNQYNCEKCQKKVNAHKGLKVTKFPYLLTIQLKRFDFDYTTMHRIKLNDRMTFPDLLNLNPFVEAQEAAPSTAADDKNEPMEVSSPPQVGGEPGLMEDEPAKGDNDVQASQTENILPEVGPSGESDDEGICVDGTMGGGNSSAGSPIDGEEDGENSDRLNDSTLVNQSTDHQLTQELLKEGPFVYELFSIMVHSGSANGGHYYAYIKNLDTKVWYCFNDQVVTRASIEDIRKTYGGASSSPFMYSSYGSSTNAYMLMYRQIDAERNVKLPSIIKLPEHIRRMLDKVHLEEEEQRLLEERQRALITLRLYFYHPEDGRLLENEFQVQKRDTVFDVTTRAYQAFGLASLRIPLPLCRLVRFSKSKETLEAPLEEDRTIQQELPWTYVTPELLLEVAPSRSFFRPYTSHGLTLKVYLVDLEAGRVRLPKFLLYATKDMSVNELKLRIAQYLNCSSRGMTLVLDHYSRNLRLLDVPDKALADEDMWSPATLFVEVGTSNDEVTEEEQSALPLMTAEEFEKTRFYAILDQFKNMMKVNVTLPSINEYEAVGFTSPFRARIAPTVIQELDDVHMSSAHGSPCPPLASGSAVGAGAVGGARFALGVQHTEECSTASGSTQYVTPATSRSSTPDRLDSVTSPVSQDDLLTGPTTPELEVTMSGGVTPSPQMSPQVSPDASPIGAGRNEPYEGTLTTGFVELTGPRLFGFGSIGINDYQPPPQPGFDSDLSKIDVDLDMDEHPANDELMGCCSKEETSTPPSEKVDYYFSIVATQPGVSSVSLPVLSIEADKRMFLLDFVQKLSAHVGVDSDQFKLYKTYAAGEYECTFSSTTTLDSLTSTNGLRVKLGRPLKDGEQLVKFLRFELNDLEALSKHLFDIALTKSSKIDDIKRECQTHLKKQCGLDVPTNRIRLRDSGNGYLDILHDDTVISDRPSYWSNDLYVQVLEEPEPATTLHHTAVFLRRWCPSTLSLGPVQEIILSPKSEENSADQSAIRLDDVEFFRKVGHLSNIPLNRLQFSAGSCEGAFPYECGKLKLLEETQFYGLPADLDLTQLSSLSTGCDMDSEGDGRKRDDDGGDQEAGCSNISSSDLFANRGYQLRRAVGFQFQRPWGQRGFTVPHDGILVYYRDAQEQPKILNDDERKELQIRDNARLRKNQTSYSWRKERALKIYTEISSSLADELD